MEYWYGDVELLFGTSGITINTLEDCDGDFSGENEDEDDRAHLITSLVKEESSHLLISGTPFSTAKEMNIAATVFLYITSLLPEFLQQHPSLLSIDIDSNFPSATDEERITSSLAVVFPAFGSSIFNHAQVDSHKVDTYAFSAFRSSQADRWNLSMLNCFKVGWTADEVEEILGAFPELNTMRLYGSMVEEELWDQNTVSFQVRS